MKHADVYLSLAEFRRSLRLGLGRAWLHVQSCGIEKTKDQVLYACFHNLALDPQCEPGRAKWLFRMFYETPAYAEFSQKICRTLLISDPNETWTLDQLCELTLVMAQHGDHQAREALRWRVYYQVLGSRHDHVGVEDWIDLEGLIGLLEIAQFYGQRLLIDPSDWPGGLWCIPEEYKDAVEAAAQMNRAIHAYWRFLVDKDQKRSSGLKETHKERMRRKYPLELILSDSLLKQKHIAPYVQCGRYAEPKEIEQILERLIREPNEDFCFKLLWSLRCSKRPIPYLPERIFEWAGGENQKFRSPSFMVLGRLQHERVRELAQTKLQNREIFAPANQHALCLLMENYESEDAQRISEILEDLPPDTRETQADWIENVGYDLLKLGERHSDPNLDQAIKWLYENTPSTNHRHRALKFLCIHARATPQIIYESCYDSHPATQDLARQLIANSP